MPNDAKVGCKALFNLVELIEFNLRFRGEIQRVWGLISER
jgi:hypothetical protein